MDAIPTSPISGTPVPFPFAAYLGSLTSREFLSVILAIVFLFWLVYTLVVAYHWVRYGHRSLIALPALMIHVAVSAWFGLIAVSGFY